MHENGEKLNQYSYYNTYKKIREEAFLILRIFIIVMSGACIYTSLLPISYNVVNIGVIVPAIAFTIIFLAAVFWKSTVKLFKKIYSITILKWIFNIIFAALGLMLAGAVIISFMMISAINNKAEPDKTVIVLGCHIKNDQPSTTLKLRLDTAYNYLIENPKSKCIVTGGKGENEIMPEADVMYNYLIQKGIAADRIIKEDKSINTKENLAFASQIMKDNNMQMQAVIATDPYHQFRGQYFAKEAGINPQALSSEAFWPLMLCYWIREIFGIVRAFIFGY